ncbi:DUF2380 domain-containing protein [Mesorhizobium sp. KR2-14]|uniref:DUF2380 domain-containing protein n=1 Tax=Mesorhizobium sp. KR2-14 TaxID=3156610 RepID=UPI0032B472D7
MDKPARSSAQRPERGKRAWRIVCSAALLACMWLLTAAHSNALAEDSPPSLALSGFFLVDTSGELRDQTAEHDARLERFDRIMHEEVAASGRFTLAEMKCPQPRCSGHSMTMDELFSRAKDAGARFLAVGAVEKMSTLVLWARLEVYDTASRKMVFNRLITFRGDNDEAWRRAAHYVARELITNAPSQ